MPGSAPFTPPSPAGCTAKETVLDDKNHQIAMTPLTTRQLHFVNGQWQKLPEKDRETRQNCMVEDDKTVDGDETVLWTVSLTPQSDGTKTFSDTMSGARDDRPGLAELMAYVREGDTVVVWKLDRLGRNTLHILETVIALTDRGVTLV